MPTPPTPGPAAPLAPVFATMFFLAAGGVVPIYLIMLTPPGPGPWAWFGGVAVFAAARFAVLLARGASALFEMTFWLFAYLFLGLAPLVQIRSGAYPETTPQMVTPLMGAAAGVVVVGVATFTIGAAISRGAVSPSAATQPNERRALMATGPALLMSFAYIAAIGFGAFFRSREELGAARVALSPNPSTATILLALATIPLLATTAAVITIRRRRKTAGLGLLLLIQLATMLVITNPISGARIAFGTVALSVIAMLGGFTTPRRFRIGAVSVLIGMVLVFPYADAFRHIGQAGSWGKGSPVEAMTHGDFDAFGQITNSVYYVDGHGTTDGRQALGVALFWVPRSVWENKPPDTGILVAANRGYGFTNLSAPLWAELFVNGGWAALALGMGALGWTVRRLDRRRALSDSPGIAGCILPFFFLMVLRGSLLQATATLVTIIVMSALLTQKPDRPALADTAVRRAAIPVR